VTVVLVTGTDTGVGKTVVTAALAAVAGALGARVAVLKPAQTGLAEGEQSDVDTVRRLAGPVHARTLAEFPDALAPLAAARVVGRAGLALDAVLTAVAELRASHDLVLVEGAGGLLVPMGEGWTTADLGQQLDGPAVVVARAGLGTLNHTALTLEALSHRGIPAYVVIGAWPAAPELVHRMNLVDLPGARVGIVPEGVGQWPASRFRAAVPQWFSPGFVEGLCDGSD
jgi:dethiobiotin synthetase